MGPIAQVHVLGQRIGLPATDVIDAGTAPHTRRAIEVEEQAVPVPGLVLDGEVGIQEQSLGSR